MRDFGDTVKLVHAMGRVEADGQVIDVTVFFRRGQRGSMYLVITHDTSFTGK